MRPKILFIISILFTAFVNINAHPSVQDSEILKGLDYVYNLKFEDAEKTFRKIQIENPDSPEGYFYESLLYFYRAMPARDDNLFEKFLGLSDIVIEKSEKILDKNENNYDALYYKGMSHSYRSLLMLTLNKSLLSAASNGSDGYRILSGLIEMKPDYYDAYMGLGLYKLAIGFVPEKFQWLLSLIGFEGNINEGMKLLATSMKKGKFTKTDSKVFISIFSLKEKEDKDKQALEISEDLTKEYPESAIFKVFYSLILLQNGFINESIAAADDALRLNINSFQDEIKKAASAVLGTDYFRLNDYQKAITYFEDFTKYLHPKDRYNVYLFTLGVSYELTGDRKKAIECYKRVRDDFINERDGELDKFFYRQAGYKINKKLNEFEIMLIKGVNLRESNKPLEAVKVFEEMKNLKLPDKFNSDDDKAKFYFESGMAYSFSKDFDKAIENFEKCISLNPDEETWIIPHSYFELGKIYAGKGSNEKSEEMFNRIFDYDDFDFESFLEMRLVNFRNSH